MSNYTTYTYTVDYGTLKLPLEITTSEPTFIMEDVLEAFTKALEKLDKHKLRPFNFVMGRECIRAEVGVFLYTSEPDNSVRWLIDLTDNDISAMYDLPKKSYANQGHANMLAAIKNVERTVEVK